MHAYSVPFVISIRKQNSDLNRILNKNFVIYELRFNLQTFLLKYNFNCS